MVQLALMTMGIMSYAEAMSSSFDKLTYHNDYQRSGWNAHETTLTPEVVSGAGFGRIWRTSQFDSFDGQPPRLFATPLYVDAVEIYVGSQQRRNLSVVYAVTTTAYVYAINAFTTGGVAAGSILWRVRLTEKPCFNGAFGNLSTPVIDLERQRLYVTSCDSDLQWRAHALDIRSGEPVPGWPVQINSIAVNACGVSRNGTTQFAPTLELTQRGALNLAPDGSRLYVTFGAGGAFANGWIVAVGTAQPKVASAFSATAVTEERQGGIWASGGPAVDTDGYIYVATGSNVSVLINRLGYAGVFPDSANNWGQSILQLLDDPQTGLELTGTYTPFNYCQAAAADSDLGSSSVTLIDLDSAVTSTPHLLALGGGKQGNAYLLDRRHMPGGLVKRPACSADPESDGSLLAPQPQPQFGRRGPLNVFGPYSEDRNLEDQAKSRTTAAYFHDARGKYFLFVTGSAKTGEEFKISTPPGLARLEIVTVPGKPAYLRIDRLERTQTFQNPGSPIVTSNGSKNAIVWVLDENAPRTAPLYGPDAPRPVLYAFDALSLKLLWKSAPGQLATSGKYNEPTVARGVVFVGTDRIEAFSSGTPAIETESPATNDAAPAKEKDRVTAAAKATAKIDSAKLYAQRCAMCHDLGQAGIPTRASLSMVTTEKIVFALQHGAMQNQAFGLSREEIEALARYLSAAR